MDIPIRENKKSYLTAHQECATFNMKKSITFSQVLEKLEFEKVNEDQNYVYYVSEKYGRARVVMFRGRIACVTVERKTYSTATQLEKHLNKN